MKLHSLSESANEFRCMANFSAGVTGLLLLSLFTVKLCLSRCSVGVTGAYRLALTDK